MELRGWEGGGGRESGSEALKDGSGDINPWRRPGPELSWYAGSMWLEECVEKMLGEQAARVVRAKAGQGGEKEPRGRAHAHMLEYQRRTPRPQSS